jgi:hypothetical protein
VSEFLKSNKQLDEIISSATNFESLREVMKSQLQKDGVIARDAESLEYGSRLLPGSQRTEPTSSVPLPASPAPATCVRVVYPHLNERYEIHGASEAELDAREAKIRAMFA